MTYQDLHAAQCSRARAGHRHELVVARRRRLRALRWLLIGPALVGTVITGAAMLSPEPPSAWQLAASLLTVPWLATWT